jgi:hypothetical protein
VLSTCQRCIRTGVSDLSGQNNGGRPSQRLVTKNAYLVVEYLVCQQTFFGEEVVRTIRATKTIPSAQVLADRELRATPLQILT